MNGYLKLNRKQANDFLYNTVKPHIRDLQTQISNTTQGWDSLPLPTVVVEYFKEVDNASKVDELSAYEFIEDRTAHFLGNSGDPNASITFSLGHYRVREGNVIVDKYSLIVDEGDGQPARYITISAETASRLTPILGKPTDGVGGANAIWP